MKRLLVCTALTVSMTALLSAAYANARHPQPRCTHGESSVAVSILHGHVKIIDPVTRTGC